MAKRTNFNINKFRDKVNSLLAKSDSYVSQEEKKALCNILEWVLMDTGNYTGYNDLYWWQKGAQEWRLAGEPEDKTPFVGPEYSRIYF